MIPLSILAAGVLCLLARTGRGRAGALIFGLTASLLFATSALYHRRTWAPAARRLMRRLDHSMIFVLIAGTYTPFTLLFLHGVAEVVLLAVAWGGAGLGIAARMAWLSAPKWAIVPPYLALGWVAAFVLPALLHAGGVAPLVLLLAGGGFYSLGALAYATQRPDPRPQVFGYHEVFHACTLVAWLCHVIALGVALTAVATVA
jgi:hemolysin III